MKQKTKLTILLVIIALALVSISTMGQTIGASQIKKDGVTIGGNSLNQVVAILNPTSGYLPYNNAGILSDSWWSQDASYSILFSGKKIKGAASASNISFNTTFGAGSIGFSANAVAFDKGWSYVSSLGASSGFGVTTYHAINLAEYAIVNPTKIRLAGPIINFANAPPYITTSDTTNYKVLFRNATTGDIGWGAITGGGGTQTLAQTLVFGNSTGGTSIVSPDGKSLLNVQDGLAQLQYVNGADEGGIAISPLQTYILNLTEINLDAPLTQTTNKFKVGATTIDALTLGYSNYALGVDGSGSVMYSAGNAGASATGHRFGRYNGTTFSQFALLSGSDLYHQFSLSAQTGQTSVAMFALLDAATNVKFSVDGDGNITASDLSGTGTRMVVADAGGVLSTQSISSGTISKVFTFDGQGGTIATNSTATAVIDVSGTITGWTLLEISNTPVSSSITIDTWKDTYANYPPTVADAIWSTKPNLSAGIKNQATGLSIAVTAGDVLKCNIDSNSGAIKCKLIITISQ